MLDGYVLIFATFPCFCSNFIIDSLLETKYSLLSSLDLRQFNWWFMPSSLGLRRFDRWFKSYVEFSRSPPIQLVVYAKFSWSPPIRLVVQIVCRVLSVSANSIGGLCQVLLVSADSISGSNRMSSSLGLRQFNWWFMPSSLGLHRFDRWFKSYVEFSWSSPILRLKDRVLSRSKDQTELVEVKARSSNEMKKTLNCWDLTWFGNGAVIGSSIFVLTGLEAKEDQD
ncbi:hypothetical protein SESBI_17728 [Sesbania bispinosa]|nr:hypothetical protein SESBI_17728 [Sesbania bispinosa]